MNYYPHKRFEKARNWKVKYGAFTPNDETKYMSSYDNEFHTERTVIQGDQYIIE